MSYQALYRKWRPAAFDEIVGQDAVVTTLKNQIRADRIGHAYLFCGTRGTGKTSAAKIFARAVNCPNAAEHDGNPCNECEVCRGIASGRAMNVFEIDAASNNGVDNIRDIREQVEYPPVTGRFKVYIIDEVHMLSTGAFNALLKTLEEPPSYVIFILATTDPQKIPATVLSRCQRYDFRRMGKRDISGHLQEITEREGVRVEPKALEYIAEAADGSMRDSLSILDQCLAFHYGELLTYKQVLEILGAADTTAFSGLLQKIHAYDPEGCIGLLSELIDAGRDVSQLILDFLWYLRNVLLVRSIGGQTGLELSEETFARAQADAGLVGREELITVITALAELSNRLRFSSQKRVQLEVELIRLCVMRQGAETGANVRDAVLQTAPGMGTGADVVQTAGDMGKAISSRMTPVQGGRTYGDAAPDGTGAGADIPGAASGSSDAELPWDAGQTMTAASARTDNPASAKIHIEISDHDRAADMTAMPTEARTDHGYGAVVSGSGQGSSQTGGQSSHAQHETVSGQQSPVQGNAPAESTPRTQPGSIIELVRQSWNLLISELSASNRPLFAGVMLKEERGNIVLVFKNRMNYTLAAKNAEENGVMRLRELAQSRLGVRANFMARIAKPGEIDANASRVTDEELARIPFPVTIED